MLETVKYERQNELLPGFESKKAQLSKASMVRRPTGWRIIRRHILFISRPRQWYFSSIIDRLGNEQAPPVDILSVDRSASSNRKN